MTATNRACRGGTARVPRAVWRRSVCSRRTFNRRSPHVMAGSVMRQVGSSHEYRDLARRPDPCRYQLLHTLHARQPDRGLYAQMVITKLLAEIIREVEIPSTSRRSRATRSCLPLRNQARRRGSLARDPPPDSRQGWQLLRGICTWDPGRIRVRVVLVPFLPERRSIEAQAGGPQRRGCPSPGGKILRSFRRGCNPGPPTTEELRALLMNTC